MHTPVITQKFRERTDAARVLMLLGVVLIHCNILSFIPGGGNRAVTCAVGFFSEGLPSMCVPWFFLVSAYLSAIRRSDADYGGFVRRRVRSILVPYLVWNSLAVAVRMAVQLTPLGQYTSGGISSLRCGRPSWMFMWSRPCGRCGSFAICLCSRLCCRYFAG